MWRSFVFVGIILAVLFGIGLFLPGSNTVVLTEHGFSPRELTISAGDTVTFINKRDKYFWPASDFHPTHTAYPEFDAQEALPPGASWSFTFDEPGLHKYHDHLAPFFFGIVRVRNDAGELVDHCRDRGGNLACWQDQIFIALAEDGIGGAYDAVATLYKEHDAFASSCHFIAHNIGLASYGFYREDPASVMSPKASACASGFYHGFMEAYLGATGDVRSASDTCDTIGAVLADEAPDARMQCYHGIGHGAMELLVAGSGVFSDLDEMVSGALEQCEAASPGDEERFRCASGLFNGIANFYINGEYGLSVETSDPLALCARQQHDRYKEACFGNMNSVIFWSADNNFPAAAARAVQTIEEDQLPLALEYLSGLYAFNSLPIFSDEPVVRACHELGSLSTSCIRGFAHGLLEHGVPHEEYKRAIAFCGSALLTPGEQTACYEESIGELPGWYSEEQATAICNNLPVALQSYCAR